MRIFVGIYLPLDIRKEILEFQKQHSDLDVRWVPEDNLHITLVPPWKVDSPDEVISQLQRVSILQNIVLKFPIIEFGPLEPRLIWSPATAGIEEATEFRSSILSVLNFTPEKRSYLPHITIAKIRVHDIPQFQNKTLHENIDWEIPVTRFSLIESHLTRDGAVYEEIKRFGQ